MQPIKYRAHGRKSQNGAALVLTLVAVAIASLLAAAIASLALSHNNRARTDQDALKALYAADAALNYQTQRIFATTGVAQVAYNGSNVEAATYGLKANPIPVTDKGCVDGATTRNLNYFLGLNVTAAAATTDYCRCWIEYPASATSPLDLTSPNLVYLYGEARVNGVTRTVRAKAGASGLFDTWAVFTNGNMAVGGSMSVTPTAAANPAATDLGIVGSNAVIDINADLTAVGGQVVYGTGIPDSGFASIYGGKAVELPSINELAEAAYLAGGYTTNASSGVAKFAVANDNLTLGTYDKNKNGTVAMPTDGSIPNQGGYPLMIRGKDQVSGQPQKVANFYLTRLDGSGVTIWADVSKGPVNLWVSNTGTGNAALDGLQGNVDIVAYSVMDTSVSPPRPKQTLNDAKKFHIYYSNQNGSLKITGGGSTGYIFAMLYAYNIFNGVPAGTINVAGGVTVNGAAYMNTLTGTGNFEVNYPSNISITDGAGILFGLQNPWQEVSPVRGN